MRPGHSPPHSNPAIQVTLILRLFHLNTRPPYSPWQGWNWPKKNPTRVSHSLSPELTRVVCFHISLARIRQLPPHNWEGLGSVFIYRDGEAWWAAIYGVAQSRTRLKWLSSSSIINRQSGYENSVLHICKLCSSYVLKAKRQLSLSFVGLMKRILSEEGKKSDGVN